MKFGAGIGNTAISDKLNVRDYAQTLDGAGFDFVTVSGHLLGAEPDRYSERPNAGYVGPFHEPFVLFAYLSALTERLRFRTSILILPQFQTAAVAKQAAELSMLSGGRFELGVGLSWHPAEYQALGADFHTRGRRIEEQVTLLRRFWSEPVVEFEGRWHSVDRVGLNWQTPLSIPIWFGGGADDRILRRIARLGDGWLPQGDPTEGIARVRQYLVEYGKDPAAFGLTGRVVAGAGGPDAWIKAATGLQAIGTTHIAIGAPPDLAPSAAVDRIVEAKKALAAALGD